MSDLNITSFPKKKVKILIAEDDLNCLIVANLFFRHFDAEVLNAINGLEAINMVNQNQDIDLIILDISMPIVDGLQACKELKKNYPHIPIIAYTAFAMGNHLTHILSAGFDDYMFKPTDKEVFLKKVEKFISLKGLET